MRIYANVDLTETYIMDGSRAVPHNLGSEYVDEAGDTYRFMKYTGATSRVADDIVYKTTTDNQVSGTKAAYNFGGVVMAASIAQNYGGWFKVDWVGTQDINLDGARSLSAGSSIVLGAASDCHVTGVSAGVAVDGVQVIGYAAEAVGATSTNVAVYKA